MTDHNEIFSPFTQEAVGRLLRRREGRNANRPSSNVTYVNEALRSVESIIGLKGSRDMTPSCFTLKKKFSQSA
jgi:hypothetical protein